MAVPARKPRRSMPLTLFAALLAAPAGAQQTYTQAVTFQTTDAPVWDISKGTNTYTYDKSFQYGFPNVPPALIASSDHDVITTPGFGPIPATTATFGGEVSLITSIKAGLGFHAYVTAGKATVSYPVTVALTYPDASRILAGQPFTLHSSYSVDSSASLMTQGAGAGARVGGTFKGNLQVIASATAFSKSLFDTTLLNISPNQDNTTLFDTDSPIFQNIVDNLGTFSLKDGYLTGSFHIPRINATGGLLTDGSGNLTNDLAASGSDKFLTLDGDISNMLLALADLPPVASQSFSFPSGDISFAGSLTGSYSVLDLNATLTFSPAQSFELDPTVLVTLHFPESVALTYTDPKTKSRVTKTLSEVTFPAGTDVTITFPTDAPNGSLTVTPTYSLSNAFSNTTSLVITPGITFNPFEVSLSGTALGYSLGTLADYQPIPTQSVSDPISVPLYTSHFPLTGFNTARTAAFNIQSALNVAPTVSGLQDQSGSPLSAIPVYLSRYANLDPNANLTVVGTGFNGNSQVNWNGSPRTTTLIDGTHLSFAINAGEGGDDGAPGTATLTITNPGQGGGTSNALTVPIENPTPLLAQFVNPSLPSETAPASAPAGTPGLTIEVQGYSIADGATAFVNGSPRLTHTDLPENFGQNHQYATIDLTASDLADPRTLQITVANPAPSLGASGALTFTVTSPTPRLDSLNPAKAFAGAPDTTVILRGMGFIRGSRVEFDGQLVPTRFDEVGQMHAIVPAGLLRSAGRSNVIVVNPDGSKSGSQEFLVENPQPTLVSVSPQYITRYGASTLTLTGTGFVKAPSNGKDESHVQWEGSTLLTPSSLGPGQLRVGVSAGLIQRDGIADIRVVTPEPGGGESNSLRVYVDTIPPVTTAQVTGQKNSAGNFTGQAVVTLSAHDQTSGVAGTTYQVDGGTAQAYTAPITLTTLGSHTITFASADKAGNIEATQSVTALVSAPIVGAHVRLSSASVSQVLGGHGGLGVSGTLINSGGTDAAHLHILSATLRVVGETSHPTTLEEVPALPTLAANGGTTMFKAILPSLDALSGHTALLQVTGTFDGGQFASSYLVTLP